jgi:hypothetical protein
VGVLASFACSSVEVLTLLGSPKAHLADRHPTPIEVRPHVCAALAASCAVVLALTTNHFRMFSTTNQNDFGIVSFRIG